MTDLTSCGEQLEELQEEFKQLMTNYEDYKSRVDSLKEVEMKCISGIKHQKYRMKQILEDLNKLKVVSSGEELDQVIDMKSNISQRFGQFKEMEETLPREISMYLKIVLGAVNVSLLSKMEKFAYKQDYEMFKFYITIITMVFSSLLFLFFNNRVLDSAFHFLLVWYYCTLTIREHILIANGSRIKGWWITHHFVTTAASGITLIWPQSASYTEFRNQLMLYAAYVSLIQIVQYNYQSGQLYKLRALGGGHSLHITVDGFMSWMWRRLSFVLPFLFVGYLFQLYNAITLYRISCKPQHKEWQITALAVMYFVLFVGNFSTVLQVIQQKLNKDGYTLSALHDHLTNKYRFSLLRPKDFKESKHTQ